MAFQAPTPVINAEAPLSVNSVSILGTSITRKSFLNNITSGVFKPQTTADLFNVTKDIAARLDQHDIFEEIQVFLDTNKQNKDTVDVTIQLKEKPRGLIQTGVGLGNNEFYSNGGFVLRNLFGGAESLSTSFAFGNRTKQAVEASFTTPLNGSPYTNLSVFVNNSIHDYSLINAYKEEGQTAGLKFKTRSDYGGHELSYACTKRDITGLPQASGTVRSQSGQNNKSSVYHSFVHDTRDHVTLPTKGRYIGLFQEFAGVATKGDVQFIKHELVGQCLHTLQESKQGTEDAFRLSLSIGGKAGYLTSLDNKEINLSDRFYLGGPLSVRGFKSGGIGARDGNDSVGGNAYWALGASLISTIPGSAHLPIKLHAFANAGNLSQQQNNEKTLQDLIRDPRVSVGAGVIFHHEFARVEANFCVPLQSRPGDIIEEGIQFGFGINFL
ncbi:surface antigen-domain-containing protein [Cunninghamella echinulata]|nr:surface antigen-domain-containing protein [Cunninghamella echinulata]